LSPSGIVTIVVQKSSIVRLVFAVFANLMEPVFVLADRFKDAIYGDRRMGAAMQASPGCGCEALVISPDVVLAREPNGLASVGQLIVRAIEEEIWKSPGPTIANTSRCCGE
jgi:hypothetical protein